MRKGVGNDVLLNGSKKTWLLLAGLLAIFLIASFISFSPEPEYHPAYVSDSPSPTGTKAFYTYLERGNIEVTRWERPPAQLPEDESGRVLVMIAPSKIPDTPEMEEYENYIKAGNTILLFTENPTSLFDLDAEYRGAEGLQKKIEDRDGNRFRGILPSALRLETKPGDQVLLKDKGGAIAIKREIGDGKLIAAVAPNWLQNDNILDENHIPLVLGLLHEAGSGPIFFDEYVHHSGSAETTLSAYPIWFIMLLAQGAFLMILLLWNQGKRFGPVLVPREETVRFSDESIQALAAWHLRSKLYKDALESQADYLKWRLQEKWRIPYAMTWKDVAERLQKRKIGINPKELESLLGRLEEILQKEQLTKQEFVFWSKKLDRLRKEVEQG